MMAVFEYTARDSAGKRFSGICDDVNGVGALREDLARMGDTLLKVRRKKRAPGKRGRISEQEIAIFAYKFAGMCSAGLSITRCLETLAEQSHNSAFSQVISDVRQRVETGSTLKDAFGKHSDIFPGLFIGMVEAGESGGRLSATLETSAAYLEKRADFRSKVKSAFAYPMIVGCLSLVVVSCLVAFVVPVFAKLYRQMHIPLPGPTQLLIDVSVLVRQQWWALAAVAAGAVFAVRAASRNEHLRARWDSFKLKIPIFGGLNRMIAATRFVRTFAMLISAGISVSRALEVAGKVANNSRVLEIADELGESIRAGNTVANSLAEHDLFSGVVVQMASCGEESGTLSEMLNKGADLLDKDIDRTIKSLLVKIEPAMTVIIGVAVGLVLLSVYIPMFDYMSHLK